MTEENRKCDYCGMDFNSPYFATCYCAMCHDQTLSDEGTNAMIKKIETIETDRQLVTVPTIFVGDWRWWASATYMSFVFCLVIAFVVDRLE